jgi:hypothetical protein
MNERVDKHLRVYVGCCFTKQESEAKARESEAKAQANLLEAQDRLIALSDA